jgi:hypothetical protein
MTGYTFPATMVRSFQLFADGQLLIEAHDNHQRLVRIPAQKSVKTLTLRPISTWGSSDAHIFSFDF